MDTQSVATLFLNRSIYFGADKNLDKVTFFSGLIGDVRIYKQALSSEEIAVLAQ